MPFIDSKVNVRISKDQETVLKTKLTKAAEAILGKSESWIMAGFQDEYHLYFRGSDSEPTAFVEVKIYGSENKSAFSKMTGEICKIFNEVLGISADRIYVKYEAVSNWGFNGSNF